MFAPFVTCLDCTDMASVLAARKPCGPEEKIAALQMRLWRSHDAHDRLEMELYTTQEAACNVMLCLRLARRGFHDTAPYAYVDTSVPLEAIGEDGGALPLAHRVAHELIAARRRGRAVR